MQFSFQFSFHSISKMIEIIIYLILPIVLACLVFKFYYMYSCGRCKCKTDMTGKTVIITGGNRGIGRETAHLLAVRGAKVIIGCRNMTSANQAVQELTDDHNNNLDIVAKHLDLSSFESIKCFSKDIERNESNVSVLICNAATIPAKGKRITSDGLEEQFAVNHFGHFLLTNLLVKKLIKASPSRIIVVSSVLHHLGHIDLNNMNFEKAIVDPYQVYWNTKLANILFVNELSRRLEGSQVTVNACHPGLVQTDIIQELWYWQKLLKPILYRFCAKTMTQGSQTIIHLVLANKLQFVSGKYFSDCRETKPSHKSMDNVIAKNLWDVSENLTGHKFIIPKQAC